MSKNTELNFLMMITDTLSTNSIVLIIESQANENINIEKRVQALENILKLLGKKLW